MNRKAGRAHRSRSFRAPPVTHYLTDEHQVAQVERQWWEINNQRQARKDHSNKRQQARNDAIQRNPRNRSGGKQVHAKRRRDHAKRKIDDHHHAKVHRINAKTAGASAGSNVGSVTCNALFPLLMMACTGHAALSAPWAPDTAASHPKPSTVLLLGRYSHPSQPS